MQMFVFSRRYDTFGIREEYPELQEDQKIGREVFGVTVTLKAGESRKCKEL